MALPLVAADPLERLCPQQTGGGRQQRYEPRGRCCKRIVIHQHDIMRASWQFGPMPQLSGPLGDAIGEPLPRRRIAFVEHLGAEQRMPGLDMIDMLVPAAVPFASHEIGKRFRLQTGMGMPWLPIQAAHPIERIPRDDDGQAVLREDGLVRHEPVLVPEFIGHPRRRKIARQRLRDHVGAAAALPEDLDPRDRHGPAQDDVQSRIELAPGGNVMGHGPVRYAQNDPLALTCLNAPWWNSRTGAAIPAVRCVAMDRLAAAHYRTAHRARLFRVSGSRVSVRARSTGDRAWRGSSSALP